ncbi:DUF1501 domain-containing protein [Sabulilitoribacter arenilitoris]|uniref:DUF1501 domain-containing protein n=1 Tax=Wocania arenilitoris TaxID=2044858 RepID=A0AAE3EP69_9FLAO|nr:DUF1501 domain-containing protein [Wocania arenilitoris]MCF7567480.1 DUF1501 domain-containing protein [Wocania arenilitoris]
MDLYNEAQKRKLEFTTRRHFLKQCTTGLGGIALSSLIGPQQLFASNNNTVFNAKNLPHFLPKAKRVIYLHMAGAPSQLELFDYKPELQKLHDLDCPKSLLEGKRFAFIQGIPKMLGPQFNFKKYGESGTYISDALPYFSTIVDDVSIVKSMHTDEFNHAPAQLLLQTGSARSGRPSMGAWVTYGLGSENDNLPGYMVLVSGGKNPSAGKNAWGSGFLPSEYQGVQCRNSGDPILYVSNPNGMSRDIRKKSLKAINDINKKQHKEFNDDETLSRISQYEMAFKMQISVPDVMDVSKEPDYIREMYGAKQGETSFANNCLLARRLVEQGVRFVQLYDWGWDMHGDSKAGSLNEGLRAKSKEIDKPMTALVKDLKQRGLLDDTLIVWGGEFGRTPMRENREGRIMPYYGRDHHTEAYTIWMAGGGIKGGFSYGETDEIGYYGIKDRVHIHDLQATILNQLGINHEKFTYNFQGRDFRLTDVHGRVIKDLLV